MNKKTNINQAFFVFTSKYVSSAIIAPPVCLEGRHGENYAHHKLIRGVYSGIKFPIVFRQEDGKKALDIIETGFAFLYLISDRLKNILEDNQFTGWKTYPAKIYDRKGNEIKGYHGFSVTGRCGPVRYKRDSIVEKRLVSNGPLCRYYKGIYFDENQWDGTDLFLLEGRYRACITERAAGILKNSKLTNVYIQPMVEIEVDEEYVSEGEFI